MKNKEFDIIAKKLGFEEEKDIKVWFTRGEVVSAMREKIDRLIQKRAIQEMLLYDRNDMVQIPKGKITPESDLEL